jgi:hypothetical protein
MAARTTCAARTKAKRNALLLIASCIWKSLLKLAERREVEVREDADASLRVVGQQRLQLRLEVASRAKQRGDDPCAKSIPLASATAICSCTW